MTETDLQGLWVYLAATPLFWLTATLSLWLGAQWLYERTGRWFFLNPIIVTVGLLIGLLALSGTPYAVYFDGAQFVHFLLGPATVALAIPLYRLRVELRTLAIPIGLALLVGATLGALSAVWLAMLFDADRAVLLSLAPKSVTTPVAMGIADKLGGIPELTAAVVVTTGLAGATLGVVLLRWLGIRDEAAIGVALGTAAHGVGTARAFQLSARTGALAGLSMALAAVLTALLLPWLLGWLGLV